MFYPLSFCLMPLLRRCDESQSDSQWYLYYLVSMDKSCSEFLLCSKVPQWYLYYLVNMDKSCSEFLLSSKVVAANHCIFIEWFCYLSLLKRIPQQAFPRVMRKVFFLKIGLLH